MNSSTMRWISNKIVNDKKREDNALNKNEKAKEKKQAEENDPRTIAHRKIRKGILDNLKTSDDEAMLEYILNKLNDKEDKDYETIKDFQIYFRGWIIDAIKKKNSLEKKITEYLNQKMDTNEIIRNLRSNKTYKMLYGKSSESEIRKIIEYIKSLNQEIEGEEEER